MAEPPGRDFDTLIELARQHLNDVQVIRRDERSHRALLDMEGSWGTHRVIISEIRLARSGVRYAYYVLDAKNQLFYGFDNSPDLRAIKLHYASNWRAHLHERVPHLHAANDTLSLTQSMTLQSFLDWLVANIPMQHV